eukprot:jgi/Galph1/2261/GphlegSOOS_G946.1
MLSSCSSFFLSSLCRTLKRRVTYQTFSTSVVNIENIKELRKLTGAPISDVKKALQEEGNIESAIEWLRRRGVEIASKKSERTAEDGLVAALVAKDGSFAAAIEVNCESDFVAKTEQFQKLAKNICSTVLEQFSKRQQFIGGVSEISSNEFIALKQASVSNDLNIEDMVSQTVAQLDPKYAGLISCYIHNSLDPSLGKIASLVSLYWNKDAKPSAIIEEKIQNVGKDLCLHVTASSPQYTRRGDIPQDVLEHERTFLLEQAKASGKPEHAIQKIVDGKLRKFFEERVFLDQPFVRDQDSSKQRNVATYVQELSEEAGFPIFVGDILRLSVGRKL